VDCPTTVLIEFEAGMRGAATAPWLSTTSGQECQRSMTHELLQWNRASKATGKVLRKRRRSSPWRNCCSPC